MDEEGKTSLDGDAALILESPTPTRGFSEVDTNALEEHITCEPGSSNAQVMRLLEHSPSAKTVVMMRIWIYVRLLCWTTPIVIWSAIRLFGLVVCLSPGFVRFAWYYFVTAHRKSVYFGRESCRQTLDVYSIVDDRNRSEQNLVDAPVVIFYTGGAWMIGYKMWGALLARALNAAGIIVVIPDMRNYPWATVPSMVNDVDKSLAWTLDNISNYGGDSNKVVVVGQSAGGHVACTALLKRASRLLSEESDSQSHGSGNMAYASCCSWRPMDIKGFIFLSAPLSLATMEHTFSRYGFDEHIVDRIFGGDQEKYDPHLIVGRLQQSGPQPTLNLPPIQIYHGSLDKTVPCVGSEVFVERLKNTVIDRKQINFACYEGWSHTDAILEGPMDADHRFHRDIFHAIQDWTKSPDLRWPENDPRNKNRLCPHSLVRAARFCNPF